MLRLKVKAAVLGGAALTCAAPAAAEVVRTTDSSFVTRHEAVVKATPKEVWLALISPSGWWQAAHTWSGDPKNLTLTPQAGGCFCERIPEVDEPGRFTLEGSVEHMRVVQAYPEQALRMVGSLGPLQSEPVSGVLTIAITKVEQGTRIVWEYNVGGSMRYEVPVISKAVDGVMGAQLGALAKLLGVVVIPAAPVPTNPAPTQPVPTAPATAKPAVPPASVKPAGTAPTQAPLTPRTVPAAAGASPKSGAAQVPAGTGTAVKAATVGAVPVKAAAPTPAGATTATKAVTTPAKPSDKASSVEDAFGDLKDKPKP